MNASVRRIGSGPELVWIHGLGEASTCFDEICARMPGFLHVLPDLPGYGRSPWPDAPPSLDALADQLAAWLGGRAPIVIGHSMGGVLAVLLAERAPVRAIVDVEGNLSRGDCMFSGRAAAWSRGEFRARGFAELRAWIAQLADAEPAGSGGQRALRGYHAALAHASPDAYYQHACELVALSESEQLAPRLAALRVPALYLAGGEPDGICSKSRELLDTHGVRWRALEPSGHWVYVDQPERFVAAISELALQSTP